MSASERWQARSVWLRAHPAHPPRDTVYSLAMSGLWWFFAYIATDSADQWIASAVATLLLAGAALSANDWICRR